MSGLQTVPHVKKIEQVQEDKVQGTWELPEIHWGGQPMQGQDFDS